MLNTRMLVARLTPNGNTSATTAGSARTMAISTRYSGLIARTPCRVIVSRSSGGAAIEVRSRLATISSTDSAMASVEFHAKQAVGTHQQDQAHDQERQHQGNRWHQDCQEGHRDADQQPAPEGARQAAHPADDHHDERVDQDGAVQPGREAEDRTGNYTPKGSQRGAERKHAREDGANVHPKPRDHLSVGDTGADDRAQPRAPLDQPQTKRDQQSDADHK